MDSTSYQQEVDRLEKEISNIGENTSGEINTAKKTGGIMRYKSYFFILAVSFVFLLLLRPKFVLRIAFVSKRPVIEVDKVKFVIWWILFTVAGILLFNIVPKFRKAA